MQALREYLIPFKGLKMGKHSYRFQADEEFFRHFEYSNISSGNFDVQLTIDKRPDMIILDMIFEGNLNTDCDRCLNEIEVPMNGNHRMTIKITEEQIQDAEMASISPTEFELQVAPYIHEMIHLNIPLRKIRDCESEEFKYCNTEVLNSLDNVFFPKSDNPIWDELKKLKI